MQLPEHPSHNRKAVQSAVNTPPHLHHEHAHLDIDTPTGKEASTTLLLSSSSRIRKALNTGRSFNSTSRHHRDKSDPKAIIFTQQQQQQGTTKAKDSNVVLVENLINSKPQISTAQLLFKNKRGVPTLQPRDDRKLVRLCTTDNLKPETVRSSGEDQVRK